MPMPRSQRMFAGQVTGSGCCAARGSDPAKTRAHYIDGVERWSAENTEPRHQRLVQGVSRIAPRSLVRCTPCSSKLSGSSHSSNGWRVAAHSLSIIEYHAVSRLRSL